MMKRLLAIFLICSIVRAAPPVIAGPVLVTGNATSSAINTTGATLLCVTFADFKNDPNGSAGVVVDNYGNNWVAGGTTADAWLKCAYSITGTPLAVGPGHTVTISNVFSGAASSLTSFIAFSGYTGPVQTGKYVSVLHSFSGTGFAVGPLTPAANAGGTLVLAGMAANSSAAAPYSAPGFTVYTSAFPAWGIGAGYLVQASPAAVTATWTFGGGGFCFCGGYIASYPALAVTNTAKSESIIF